MRAERSPHWRDREIAELAERQHGVVARRQLVELGLGRGGIQRRLAHGRLHLVHRGVYAVGHRALSREGRWMAAVLVASPGAALSHRSAAALWGIRDTARPAVEVTAAHRVRPCPGVELHRSCLPSDEVTEACGIAVTTVPRTLLDLATVLPRRPVEHAINEAAVGRLTDPLPLADLLDRHPGRRGVATIRAIIAEAEAGVTTTRSELEVELDGYGFHGSADAYERDRARDRALSVAGWRVVRVTWRQLHGDPVALAADLRGLLRPVEGGRRWSAGTASTPVRRRG